MTHKAYGFTIVELLIVIVVIAILAAISTVAYSGVTDRAKTSKIKADTANLSQAIVTARVNTGKTLWQLTGGRTGGDGLVTADECSRLPSGTNFTTLSPSSDCWTKYKDTLAAISSAAGMNISSMTDPAGRPYFIYENEGRAADPCTKDAIATFQQPHVIWEIDWSTRIEVESSSTGC